LDRLTEASTVRGSPRQRAGYHTQLLLVIEIFQHARQLLVFGLADLNGTDGPRQNEIKRVGPSVDNRELNTSSAGITYCDEKAGE
jgi:hypothetical protein